MDRTGPEKDLDPQNKADAPVFGLCTCLHAHAAAGIPSLSKPSTAYRASYSLMPYKLTGQEGRGWTLGAEKNPNTIMKTLRPFQAVCGPLRALSEGCLLPLFRLFLDLAGVQDLVWALYGCPHAVHQETRAETLPTRIHTQP